jgi:sugar phosphate isomerase/epimerase
VAQRGIGLVLEGLGSDVKKAMQSASRLAYRHIELPAGTGEVDPSNLSQTGRRHLSHFVRGLGLELSALGGDPGGARFADLSGLDRALDQTRRVMELALDLHVPVMTTHLGRMDALAGGEAAGFEKTKLLVKELADLADRTGTRLAIETAANPALLARVLREVNCPALGACYDPASLLINGYDPIGGVESLANDLVLARARDAIAGSGARPGYETALGEGQIDLESYLAALEAAGHRRPPFVRRTASQNALQDLEQAKAHLDRLLR